MGLAVMTELPLVIVNSQRGGPSTGTSHQDRAIRSVSGRLRAQRRYADAGDRGAFSPVDAFACAIEACRIAVQYMTPVILLTDGYIANAAEPWKVPDPASVRTVPRQRFSTSRMPRTRVTTSSGPTSPRRAGRAPVDQARNARTSCTAIGGIEKGIELTGNIDYSPANHQRMTDARRDKIANIAVPPQEVAWGEDTGTLAVVGWGSTYGPIKQAVRRWREKGQAVSHIHVRHIWPLPANLGELLAGFDHVLVPEMNTGQFKTVLRDQYLVDCESLTKTSGQPFQIAELETAIGKYFDDVPGNEGGEVAVNAQQLPGSEQGYDDGSLHKEHHSAQSKPAN